MFIDAAIIAVESIWKSRSLADILGTFTIRTIYSIIIAAIWHGLERNRPSS
jgi:hypothetical protein